MSSYSRGEVVLVRYPFSDLSGAKVRPAIVVSTPHISKDIFIVPLTSRTVSLFPGEFVLKDWVQAGLNVTTAVKRGIYTVQQSLVVHKVGRLSDRDNQDLDDALRVWIGL